MKRTLSLSGRPWMSVRALKSKAQEGHTLGWACRSCFRLQTSRWIVKVEGMGFLATLYEKRCIFYRRGGTVVAVSMPGFLPNCTLMQEIPSGLTRELDPLLFLKLDSGKVRAYSHSTLRPRDPHSTDNERRIRVDRA